MPQGPHSVFWKSQLPVDFEESTVVINTWYEVVADLGSDKNVRCWFILVEQTNNGGTNETIEVEVEIDGTPYTCSQSLASGTRGSVLVLHTLTGGDFTLYLTPTDATTMRGINTSNGIPFIGKIGRIRVRQTTDVDLTSAKIEVNITHDLLEAV